MGQGTWRVNADRQDKGFVWSHAFVTEEVQFVTRSAVVKETPLEERLLLVFQPFSAAVWVVLLSVVILHAFMTIALQRSDAKLQLKYRMQKKKKNRESFVSELEDLDKLKAHKMFDKSDIMFQSCISCAGEHHVDPDSTELRWISAGWIFFVLVICNIYSANLTAYLSLRAVFCLVFCFSCGVCACRCGGGGGYV